MGTPSLLPALWMVGECAKFWVKILARVVHNFVRQFRMDSTAVFHVHAQSNVFTHWDRVTRSSASTTSATRVGAPTYRARRKTTSSTSGTRRRTWSSRWTPADRTLRLALLPNWSVSDAWRFDATVGNLSWRCCVYCTCAKVVGGAFFVVIQWDYQRNCRRQ